MPLQKVDSEEMFAKDKNLKHEDLKILQEWLKKQPHLPKLDDYQILPFLHSCYYRIEPTKITIDNYFTMRTHHPELFNCLSENVFRKTLSYVFAGVLPKRTHEDYAVLLVKLRDFDPEVFNFNQLVAVINMVLTLYLHQYGFVTGGCVIFDAKGFSFSHLTKFNLSGLKNALDHVQEGAPVRIKGIHFVNVVPALEKVKIMIKPILKKELFDLITFHSNFDTLYEQIPKEYLPIEYGGSLPSTEILHEQILENVLENYDYFQWHDSQKVDERKRVGEVKGSVFGMDGTFKKIEID